MQILFIPGVALQIDGLAAVAGNGGRYPGANTCCDVLCYLNIHRSPISVFDRPFSPAVDQREAKKQQP